MIMSPKIAVQFLRIVAFGSVLAALLFAIAAIGDPTGMFNIFLSAVIPGSEGVSAIATVEAKMGYAIAGGVFAGFMVMILLITVPAIERGDKAIIRASIYALLIWFIVDSGASIAGGAPMNAVSNAVFLALYLLPLVWTKEPSTATAA